MNQVQVIEKQGTRNSQWSRGYGSDTGGGDTVGLLKYVNKEVVLSVNYSYFAQVCMCEFIDTCPFFRRIHNIYGAVTSFTGTYKADKWSLTLSSSQGKNSLVKLPTRSGTRQHCENYDVKRETARCYPQNICPLLHVIFQLSTYFLFPPV